MKTLLMVLATVPVLSASLHSAETIVLGWGENYELAEGKVLTFKHCAHNLDWNSAYGMINVLGTIQGEVVLFSEWPDRLMPTRKVGGNSSTVQTGDPGYNMVVAGPMRIGTFGSSGSVINAHFFQIIATVEDIAPVAPSAGLVPTASVVIPADAIGPVEIILESSEDMVNWNTALPGLYLGTDSKRFFRVRGIMATP